MAQNLVIANAQYSDVPSISIPTQGGGSASFIDTTDADATAEDILQGKTAYVGGVKITGTGSGGGGGSKYGISLDDIIGDVDGNNVLQQSQNAVSLTISGFSDMATDSMRSAFFHSVAVRDVVFSSLVNANGRGCLYSCFDTSSITSISFPELVSAIGNQCLYYICTSCSSLTSISFPKLKYVESNGLGYAFNNCRSLTTVSFPLLEEVGGSSSMRNLLQNCKNLTSVSFPSLKYIGVNRDPGDLAFSTAFSGCNALASVDFSALEEIGAENVASNKTQNRTFEGAFNGCSLLTTITFPKLTTIWCNGTSADYGTFRNNNKVEKFYFPKLATISKSPAYSSTSSVNNIFKGCTALSELHFGSANQAAIEASTGYSTKWGAPSGCSILFDL